jgi:hypothetical protein
MTRRLHLAVIAAAAAMLTTVPAPSAEAAPPQNDAFGAAITIDSGQELSSTNLEATSQGANEPDVAGTSTSPPCKTIDEAPNCGASVWYRFVAPAGGTYTVETCDGGTDLDSTLGVYTGTFDSLVEIDSNDDGGNCAGGYGNNGSSVEFTATSGVAYFVDVGGYEAEEGSFYLRVYPGGKVARPDPDTSIDRSNSYLDAAATEGSSLGTLSGPRQTPSFLLRSDPPGASFECSLDGASFAACGPAVSVNQELAAGPHTFAARAALGGQLDATPVIERFTLDTAPPATQLLTGPTGPSTTNPVTWIAASSERYNLEGRFLCGIDSQAAEVCDAEQTYPTLCTGTHEFRTASYDKAFNVDPVGVKLPIAIAGGPEPCDLPGLGTPIAAAIKPTSAAIQGSDLPRGAGGHLRLQYGTTTAYGTTKITNVAPVLSGTYNLPLRYLAPSTEYHYSVTMVTPFGENNSGDQTFTTAATGEALPSAINGESRVAGAHAAELPFTIDSHGKAVRARVLIQAGSSVTQDSPRLNRRIEIDEGAAAPVTDSLAVSDLQPSTTYNYRLAVEQTGGDELATIGPEGSFSTTAMTAPARVRVSDKPHFKIRKRNVKLSKLKRSSKKLIAKLRGLPPKTKITLKVKIGKAKQTATRKADRKGRAKLKATLSKRIRKALHDRKTKRAKITITALPPGDTASRIVLKPKLKP